ncbi:hypothetical protein AAC387_Pa05g1889 [Persea americana]
MANIIISSSCAKTLTPITTKPSSSPPLPSKPHHHHHISIPNIKNKVLGSIRLVPALAAAADVAAAAKRGYGQGDGEGGLVRLQPHTAFDSGGVLAADGGAGQDLLHAAGGGEEKDGGRVC